jgi:hypothetical protein
MDQVVGQALSAFRRLDAQRKARNPAQPMLIEAAE